MANDNETVEQVALSDRPLADQIRIIRDNYSIGSGEFDALDEAADVVECNQREISRLKGERKGILKANESLAADNTRLRDELAAKDAEIANLRALVNGLADVVSTARPKFCNGCPAVLCAIGGKLCDFVRNADELVAKAREVVNG